MRILPFPEKWGRSVNTFLSLLVIGAVIAAITAFVVVVANSDKFEPKVIKTSENTYHIEAPNNNPEDFIASTCQKDGKRVAQLFAPAESYDELNVVCAP